MPAFITGIDYYDNWLIEHALAEGMDVINATAGILAIQQNHEDREDRDYQFRRFKGPMAQYQVSLLPKNFKKFHIEQANWVYTPSGLRRPVKLLLKEMFIKGEFPAPYSRFRTLFSLTKAIHDLFIRVRAEPISRARMKRIIYKTGEIKYPRFRALFKALRFLHRIKSIRIVGGGGALFNHFVF